MRLLLQELDTNEITENLKHIHSTTLEEDQLILDIVYLNGKFSIQKIFDNDWRGREKLQKTIEEFNTEEKVKTYLGLLEQ